MTFYPPVRSALEQGIIEILCPEASFDDIESTISRVVLTYQQIQQQQGNSQFDIQVQEEITVPEYICTICKNQDQARFVHDKKSGDTICMGTNDEQGCGNVVHDHKVFEGNMYRKFEDKEDRSHHGPAPNRFFSNPHNLKTSIEGGTDSFTFKMRQVAESVEMNLSQMGTNERRTRVGYKDKKKHYAFNLMEHVAANLSLHQQVLATARELIATYRDGKEKICNFKMVIAACLIYACRQAGDNAAQITEPVKIQSKTFYCYYCNSSFSVQKELRTHNCINKDKNQQEEAKIQRNSTNNFIAEDFRTLTSKDFSKVPMEQWDLHQVTIWLEEKTCGQYPQYISRICIVLKTIINQNVERKIRLSTNSLCSKRSQITNTSNINHISPSLQSNYTSSSSTSSNSDINKILSSLPPSVQKAKTPGQILLVLNQNHFAKICQNQEVARGIFNATHQFKIDREKRKRTEQEKEQERIHKKQRTNNHWLQDLSSDDDDDEKVVHERHHNVENIVNNHFINYYHYNPHTNIC